MVFEQTIDADFLRAVQQDITSDMYIGDLDTQRVLFFSPGQNDEATLRQHASISFDDWFELFAPSELPSLKIALNKLQSDEPCQALDSVYKMRDGVDGFKYVHHSLKSLAESGFPGHLFVGSFNELKGDSEAAFVVPTDINKSFSDEQQLPAMVFECSREAMFITDARGIIVRVNDAFLQNTDYKKEDVLGLHCGFLWAQQQDEYVLKKIQKELLANKSWRGECDYTTKQGVFRACYMSVSGVEDSEGIVSHFAGIFFDITDKKIKEEKIQRLAYYDSLTDIPNRSLFNDRLYKAIQHAQRHDSSVAVLFVDLDSFKEINDTLGHAVGDRLLQGVAKRLQYCVREEDTVGRMGGDEFAIVLVDLSELEDARKTIVTMATRMLSQFATPFLIEGKEVSMSASIGVAIYPEDGEWGDILLQNADIAMYAAKNSGKNSYQFYSSSMNVKRYRKESKNKTDFVGV